MSWFGGFAGGIAAGVWMMRRKRLPTLALLAAATPALAIGHAIGRIGCFLVGDDYGRPSSLPWAVAFPQGLPPTTVPVHPTQLYEAAALVPLALLLVHWRRHGRTDHFVLGAYLRLQVRCGLPSSSSGSIVAGPRGAVGRTPWLACSHCVGAALLSAGRLRTGAT